MRPTESRSEQQKKHGGEKDTPRVYTLVGGGRPRKKKRQSGTANATRPPLPPPPLLPLLPLLAYPSPPHPGAANIKRPEGRRGISGTRRQPPTQPPRAVGATAQRPQKSGSSTSTSLPDAYSHLWVIGRYHRRTTRARWQKRIKTKSTGTARRKQSTSSGAAPEHTKAARSVTKRVRAHVPQSCVSVHASWQSAKSAHANNGKEHEAVAVQPALVAASSVATPPSTPEADNCTSLTFRTRNLAQCSCHRVSTTTPVWKPGPSNPSLLQHRLPPPPPASPSPLPVPAALLDKRRALNKRHGPTREVQPLHVGPEQDAYAGWGAVPPPSHPPKPPPPDTVVPRVCSSTSSRTKS